MSRRRERLNIHRRQAEGIAAARARGVHLGRVAKPIPDAFYPVFALWEQGNIVRREAAARLGIQLHQFDWLKTRYRRERKKRPSP